MKTMLLLFSIFFSVISSFGQYDVDIKKNENPAADRQKKEQQEREQIGNCKFIPFHEYKEGMKFYFPRNDFKEKDDFGVMYYYYAKEAKKPDYKRTKILYKDLAGKVFIITKVEERKGIVFPDTYITLKQVDGDIEIEHQMTISRDRLKKNWEDQPYSGQTFVMPYAVYTAEIDSFRAKYSGMELYTKFYIKGKKFQKVKIVQVGAGDEYKPIRVIVENEAGEKEQEDICTCGTNVPSSFIDLYFFSNSFQIDNPKANFKGTDEVWDLICQGKIQIGMAEHELFLSWGFPKKTNETVVSGVAHKQYIYGDQYVYVENGKVISFQSFK